jgi:hypothetical protein
MSTPESLQTLGWRPFFQAQVDVDGDTQPARVLHVHRGRVEVAGCLSTGTDPGS